MLDDVQGTHNDLLREQAARQGEAPFLLFRDDVVSFAALDRCSDTLAAALQHLGVGAGDPVAVMTGNRPEFLYTWFAASKLGGVLVPVNTAHRGGILRHMLSIARCRLAVVEAQYLPQLLPELEALPELRTIVVLDGPPDGVPPDRASFRFEDLTAHRGAFRGPVVCPRDPALVMFTSGTTGPSKGSLKTQNEGFQTARITAASMGYGPDDCVYLALPLFHGAGQIMGALAALSAGARLVLVERFSASAFWSDVRRHGCTGANYVGSMIPILMKAEPRPDDADNPLRALFGAGAPASIWEAFERRFGVTLVEGYGMTEVGIMFLSLPEARRPGTCGRLQPHFEVRLVDDDGRPVPDGTPGELLVRPRIPDFLMLEYVGMPEKTVEAWRDLWFHTGDFLVREPDGFYRFKDRKKDAIRRRGENISSFELEQIVNAFPAVLECAAVGVPSDVGEEDVLICAAPKPEHRVDPGELHRHCRERMASFMVPRYIRVLESLPKTPTNRVEKYKLKLEGVTEDAWDATKA